MVVLSYERHVPDVPHVLCRREQEASNAKPNNRGPGTVPGSRHVVCRIHGSRHVCRMKVDMFVGYMEVDMFVE